MKLPAGWTAELPEAVHEKSAYATYDLTYRFDKGTLYSERKIVVLKEKVPVSDWKAYKNFTDAIGLGNETYVQLRRPNGTDLASTPTVPSSAPGGTAAPTAGADVKASPEALLRQAATALQRMDLATTQSLLDQAKSINPKERHLWSAYCGLSMYYGKANEAIEDCKKELALYPESYEAYAMLAGVQGMQHDDEAAKQTLRAWAKADPADAKPVALLAAEEFTEHKYGEAEPDLQTALKLDPADERTQLLLGQSEMRLHEIDKGTATLKTLLEKTSDPLMINDAVYELADAGKELALDESKEQVALDKLTKETESWTLDESPALLKQQTSLLEASWDTMGWILYKEGKLSEARSFIDAAWTNRQDPDVVKHHDALYPPATQSPEPKQAGSEKPQQVQIVKSSSRGLPVSTATVTVTASAPQGLRSYPLGPAKGRHGVAEYRLLLAHGRVERIEPMGEKSVEGAEAMVKQVDFAKLFPEGSDAKLVRAGMVNCFAEKCMLVLEP
jgi:tetratricopeptide (TPR) repeat protein